MDNCQQQAASSKRRTYNPQPTTCQGKILVYVQPGFYYGDNLAQAAGNSVDYSTLGNSDRVFYNTDGTLKDLYKDQVLTAQQVDRLVTEKVAIKLEDLKDHGQLIPTTCAVIASTSTSLSVNSAKQSQDQIATSSSTPRNDNCSQQVADQNQKALDNLNALLVGTNATVETLKVTGNTNLAQTQVAGTFSQDGTFIIDYGKQLNVLGSALYLQNDAFAGDENGILLDVGGGKVTLDKLGNLVLVGTITAKNIETKQITVNTSTSSPTVGSAAIASGLQSITINTSAVKPGVKILVTATTPTGGKSLYVSGKTDFSGFTVTLDGGYAENNITFDWLIISTTQASN